MSLDIETGIETFEITVLISRLVSRLKEQGGITVIETLARVTAHLSLRFVGHIMFIVNQLNGMSSYFK